jgi:hypothetical protein
VTTTLGKMTAVIEAKVRAAQPIHGWDATEIACAALDVIRGMDSHGIDLNYWSERVVDAILNEKTT